MFQSLCWCNTINLCVIQSPCCFDITNVLRRCVVFKTTHVVCNINTPQILECQTNLLHTTSLAQFSKTAHFPHPTNIGLLKLHNGIYSLFNCRNLNKGLALWSFLVWTKIIPVFRVWRRYWVGGSRLSAYSFTAHLPQVKTWVTLWKSNKLDQFYLCNIACLLIWPRQLLYL